MRKYFCWVVILCCLMVLRDSSAEECPIQIRATVNTTYCSVGDIVTVTYDIEGGREEYPKVNILWQERVDEAAENVTVAFNQMGDVVAGSCSYAPEYEGIITVSVHVTDSVGRQEVLVLPEITVGTGNSSSPMLINIATDKTYANVGEEITVYYSITGGSNDCESISMIWYETATGCRAESTLVREALNVTQGSYSYTPVFSGKITTYILVQDTENRVQFAYSPSITIEREPNEIPIQISTYVDKTRVQVGENVTIGYRITGGSGEYVKVSSLWHEYATDSNTASQVAYFYGADEDEHTFSPQFTGRLSITVHVTDSLGRSHFEYVPTVLVPSIDELEIDVPFIGAGFVLPASSSCVDAEAFMSTLVECVYCPNGLATIGNLAFSNCTELKQIYIPRSVTSIADNAFVGCNRIVIFCEKNSTAYEYARSHMMDYCLMD